MQIKGQRAVIENNNENDDIAWKFAQFTLIFSIPKAAIPENNKKDGRIYLTAVEKKEDSELTSDLTKGRDSGISELELRPEEPFKAYYKKSFSYFDSYFHDTLGSVEAENQEKVSVNKVKFYHKKFISKDENKTYRFYSEKTNSECGSVSLRACELLSYYDQLSSSVEKGVLDSTFLVLHVVAEKLSNAALERLSQNLYRSRNRMRRKGGATDSTTLMIDEYIRNSDDADNENDDIVDLLDTFVECAKEKITDSLAPEYYNSGAEFSFAVNKSGYLELEKKSTASTKMILDDPPVKPYRIVTAVPASDKQNDSFRPRRVAGLLDNEPEKYSLEDRYRLWGYLLAAGADIFFNGLPSVKDMCSGKYDAGNYLSWYCLSILEGMAFIRKTDSIPKSDWELLSLSSTRYVDLAILNLRSKQALNILRKRLGEISLLGNKLAADPGKNSSMENLEEDAKKLAQLQILLANFYRELWFDSVPDRPQATDVLLSMQEKTGALRDFEDFNRQIRVQERIIEMQYKKRLDALNRRQEGIDRERDLYIAVFAIFLGIPGVVEMFDDSTLPIDKSYFGFLILFLFIVLTVMYFLRRRKSAR